MTGALPQGHLDELDKPNLTEDELFRYLHEDEGLVFVSRYGIKQAVIRREIVPTRIGRNNLFSKRDGLNWIKSRKQQGQYRAAPRHAPVGV